MILEFSELASTNSYLLQHPELLRQDRCVVWAHHQTSGRGRMQRNFSALSGQSLTFSVVVHPQRPLDNIGIFALIAGLAVRRVLSAYTRREVRLKWPNDVYVEHRKISGILIETATLAELSYPILVIGIGVNTLARTIDFPVELQEKIINLSEICDTEFNNRELLEGILYELDQHITQYWQFGNSVIIQDWLQYQYRLNRQVRFETHQGVMEGLIKGLDDNGYLLIQMPNGEIITFYGGDVNYRD